MSSSQCQKCGYGFHSDVPDYIIEKCWECRFKEESSRSWFSGIESLECCHKEYARVAK